MIAYKELHGKMNKKGKQFLFYDFRRKMAERYISAKKRGEKVSYQKTADEFKVNRKTVIKWVKRYSEKGLKGLRDKTRAPLYIPHKMSIEQEMNIVNLRKRTGFGAKRMKMELEVNASVNAIARVLKKHGLLRKRRQRKYHKKRNMRAIKEKLKPFQEIQIDIKYIDDIAELYPFYKAFKLPRYQITARCVKTGATYMWFTHEKTINATITATDILLTHLKRHGINLKNTTIQTDNGSEFSGNRLHNTRGYRAFLRDKWNVKHKFIPPKYPNYNADVEAFHKLIENELYERDVYRSKQHFLNKVFGYLCYFNLQRKNSYRGYRTPLDYLKQEGLDGKLLIIPPIVVDNLMKNIRFNAYKTKIAQYSERKRKRKRKTVHHVGDLPG